MMDTVQLKPWASPEAPSDASLRRLMQTEGLSPYPWSNAPHDTYAAHSHTYDKVIYCVSGSITFGLPQQQRQITLHPGDRLELPAGTAHDAAVGNEGVTCLEAHL